MRFRHRDGADAAARITLAPSRAKAPIDDGTFEVDDDRDDADVIIDRLIGAGHEPLEEDDPPDEPVEEAAPRAGDFTEQEIVEQLDYREKQEIAGQYDQIHGNASDEKLTEELIKQRREELE